MATYGVFQVNIDLFLNSLCNNGIIKVQTTKYTFTENWFSKNVALWEKFIPYHFFQEEIHVLEIGVFEGASTTWIIDNLLHNPASSITCIDTFEGSMEHKETVVFSKCLVNLEDIFKKNISKSKRPNAVIIKKGFSFNMLIELLKVNKKFDLIYIDGSHMANDVLMDAVLSWKILKNNGFMIFDDYKWENYQETYKNPKIAIDSFLSCFEHEIELIAKYYQVILKKLV